MLGLYRIPGGFHGSAAPFWALLEPFALIFGESRAFTRAALLVSEFAMYGIGFPLFAWLMGRIPSCEMKEKKNIHPGQFFGCWFCAGLTYLGNMIGGILMEAAGALRGADYSNPVSDVIDQMDVGMIILTAVIIAPVMEELVFRKYLVDRLVPYGQKTAVVLSGLFFWSFSWKLYQFFYAAILGGCLPGCTAPPGASVTILLCICLSICWAEFCLWYCPGSADAGNLFAFLGYGFLNIFAYVSMVIAVILLASHYRQIHWFSGWVYREENMALTCLKAPGFWFFLAGSVLLFLLG